MTEAQRNDIIPVTDLDQFVQIIAAWHAEQCALVQHMLTIPEGSEIKIGDGEPVKMTGDTLIGFKLGIEMAMMRLGSLPFVAEMEDDAPVKDDPATVYINDAEGANAAG